MRGHCRSIFAAVLIALALATALPVDLRAAPVTTTATGPVRDQGTGVVFPMSLGTAQLVSVTDFQSPGLGFSYRYRDPSDPFIIDIYVYDNGVRIADGTDNAMVREEFQRALEGVRMVGAERVYRNLKTFDERECQYGRLAFRCIGISYEYNNQPAISMLMLRGARNHFIKVRVTFSQRDDRAVSILGRVLTDLSSLLSR